MEIGLRQALACQRNSLIHEIDAVQITRRRAPLQELEQPLAIAAADVGDRGFAKRKNSSCVQKAGAGSGDAGLPVLNFFAVPGVKIRRNPAVARFVFLADSRYLIHKNKRGTRRDPQYMSPMQNPQA